MLTTKAVIRMYLNNGGLNSKNMSQMFIILQKKNSGFRMQRSLLQIKFQLSGQHLTKISTLQTLSKNHIWILRMIPIWILTVVE